jgi:aminopeptidase N
MQRVSAFRHLLIVCALLFLLALSLQARAQNLQQDLRVEILPGIKTLKVTAHIKFPAGFPRKISFLLNKKLQIRSVDHINHLTLLHPGNQSTGFSEWGLELGADELTLEYDGNLDTPVVNDSSEGTLNADGAALFGSTYWYPEFSGFQQTFTMSVRTPAAWTALTSGQQLSRSVVNDSPQGRQNLSTWSGIYPQQDLFLVAGPFFEFTRALPDGKNIRVLLRKDDKDLADRYLNLIPDYISHFSQEIAPYPYSDFSVVENFWESGLAMPAFTLLGSTVIRLPFILTSSLPHEILHNWWGNSVYVDDSTGNWCEGLTTYMGDYWQQELQHQDADYRLTTLINYEDYVKSERDFPIRAFRQRMDSGSQAVGYGKTMMFFHMLRSYYGEDVFRKALQDFYATNKFRLAAFSDIRLSFEKILKKSLAADFSQWLDRTGAPALSLQNVRLSGAAGAYVVSFTLAQTQAEVYNLQVPVELSLSNGKTLRSWVHLKNPRQSFLLETAVKPLQLAVDPRFDLFRVLDVEEHPATLSAVLGADKIHFYYPVSLSGANEFINIWKSNINAATELHPLQGNLTLSGDGMVVLLGDDSRFAELMKDELAGQDFAMSADGLRLQSTVYDPASHSWLVVARNHLNPRQIIVWVRWSKNVDVADWAARLVHYGKYSALVFEQKPNVFQGIWPVVASPLRKNF